jgi:fructokinase
MTYAGVELGGTKCIAILATGSGEIIARETVATAAPEETLGQIAAILAGWRSNDLSALGIASFGPLDVDPASPTYGHVRSTPKPGWAGAAVAPRLQQAAGVPAIVDTDVNGAAFAEMRWGAGRGFEDFAYVTVGTGIGVGLIVGGRPTRGFAHCELGHVRVARLRGEAWPGSCPYHGDCAEGMASGSALKARLGDQLDRVRADDPLWDSVAWTLAQLCHAIVCAAAPMRIAIGGGVMERQPQLLAMIRSGLLESLNGFMALPDENYVCTPALGKDAGPLGAIALAIQASS